MNLQWSNVRFIWSYLRMSRVLLRTSWTLKEWLFIQILQLWMLRRKTFYMTSVSNACIKWADQKDQAKKFSFLHKSMYFSHTWLRDLTHKIMFTKISPTKHATLMQGKLFSISCSFWKRKCHTWCKSEFHVCVCEEYHWLKDVARHFYERAKKSKSQWCQASHQHEMTGL